MSEYNILILSAGRRVELIQCFQAAKNRLGIEGKIIAADCSNTAPALYFADEACCLPRIENPKYIDAIIEACKCKEISLIIPTIDTDLLLLAENKEKIETSTSAKLLVSSLQAIEICRDKIKTQHFLEEHGFGVSRMYSEDDLLNESINFPLFIRPKSGSSSINAFKVNDSKELDIYRQFIEEPLIQDFIEGDEYTVDVFIDFDGNIISVVPRLRIATRSGEILKGKIIKDQEIIDSVKNLINVLKPIGHITVQLMKTENGIKYIEINPRFGGGAPMSIKAGADSCESLFRLLMGERLEYNDDYQDKLMFLRFDQSICLDENMKVEE